MKTLLVLITAGLSLGAPAQDALPNPKLVGIIKIADLKVAVLETTPAQVRFGYGSFLEEGQSESDVALSDINLKSESVKMRMTGASEPRVIKLKPPSQAGKALAEGFVLEDAGLKAVLNLFGVLSERTVLQHPALAATHFTLRHPAATRAEAARLLQAALLEKEIAVVPAGDKFLLVAPKAMASILQPRSDLLAKPTQKSGESELLPKDSINFFGASIASVLSIYVEFRGEKLDKKSPLPPLLDDVGSGRGVFLQQETALTKAEALYALEKALAFHGIKLAPAGPGSVKAVPVSAETTDRMAK